MRCCIRLASVPTVWRSGKPLDKMALSVLTGIWQLTRRIDSIFQDVAQLVQGLSAVRDELKQLERRVAALEVREELLIEKTRTAASVAASSAVTQHLVDMSRRIGALEAGRAGATRIE